MGDSEAKAITASGGRLKVEPHAYTGPEGNYLTTYSSNGWFGIRFETEDGLSLRSTQAGPTRLC